MIIFYAALKLLRTAEVNGSMNVGRERKVVISIAHQVMAIHIRNYFLLIQPQQPYEGKERRLRPEREKNNKAF